MHISVCVCSSMCVCVYVGEPLWRVYNLGLSICALYVAAYACLHVFECMYMR